MYEKEFVCMKKQELYVSFIKTQAEMILAPTPT